MIKFVYIVNKTGQCRLMKYFESTSKEKTCLQERDISRTCISKMETEGNFFDYQDMKIVFKKYATLYFIVGITQEENELAILEFIHNIVETLNKYFGGVCEMDIMFNMDRVHMILDEMIQNGCIIESDKASILKPINAIDQIAKNQ